MSPSECNLAFQAAKQRLGEVAFEALIGQLCELQLRRFNPNHSGLGGLPMVPAPLAAALVARALQQEFPDNVLAKWSLEDRLRTIYAILAIELDKFFAEADAEIDFATDLEIRDAINRFPDIERYVSYR